MNTTPPRATPFVDYGVTKILRTRWNEAAGPAHWVGAGAWSDCFAFDCEGQSYVVRLGTYSEDFRKDHAAAHFASTTLPIPSCSEPRPLPDGFSFCVSDYVEGIALERVTPWSRIAPKFVELLEGLRRVDTNSFAGWGRWGDGLEAPFDSWREFLLDVANDRPGRIHGWRTALDERPDYSDAFDRGLAALQSTASDDVPRSLVHNDLLNRNVHVHDGKITGVFDWGNSLIGDHLYDLAMLCFWEPWLEGTQPQQVIAGLRSTWAGAGYNCRNFEQRLQVCLLHTGLEHIVYHASRGHWREVTKVANRIDAVSKTRW